MIKIDCAEFQHSHEIAKLIGSPPGYLGHRETHALLSQEVLNQHHTETTKITFVLFDEIEKASDALWNLLLGILDKGTLTLGDNRKVDFSRRLIFMTSNLGAAEMSALLTPKLGFGANARAREISSGLLDDETRDKASRSGVEAARRKFTPEFMNRLDKIVTFSPLGTQQLRQILDIELDGVQQRIFDASPQHAFAFSATDAAKQFLLHEGTDVKYGARHLKRAIERLVVQPLSNLIATSQVRAGEWIRVDHDESHPGMIFLKEAEGLPLHTMTALLERSSAWPDRATPASVPYQSAKTQIAGLIRRN